MAELSENNSATSTGVDSTQSDLMVIGELNMDLIMSHINKLPELGTERIAEHLDISLGSSSAILASNASALGLRVAYTGRVGNDLFGKEILKILADRGLDISGIRISDKVQTGLTMIYTSDNDRGMITYPGAMEELTINDVDWERAKNSRHLHLSSYYLQKGIRPDCLHMFRKAKSLGLTTSLDTNWDPDEKWGDELPDVLKHVDVFLPNDTEAKLISKKSTLDEALHFLSSTGCTVVATCGSNGVRAQKDSVTYHVSAVKVDAVDAVGAGDSFNAGFLKNYIHGKDLEACLAFGAITGAYSTLNAGGTTSFLDMDNFQAFYRQAESEITITKKSMTPSSD